MRESDFSAGKMWLIEPSEFDAMDKQVRRITLSKDYQSQLAKFKSSTRERDDYALRDGVAVIPITGPITKTETFFTWLFGCTAIDELKKTFSDALADPDVSAIVLDIDSPGGTIAGVDSMANMIYKARGEKPIVSFASGLMASAAYWIGSAADRVSTEPTAMVGSIGVLLVHHDWSENDKKIGLKRTYLSAGEYKALGNDAEPLSQKAREVFQGELDYFYQMFVGAVARNRGVSAEVVDTDMAQGRIFIGHQAVDAGLADTEGDLETAIETALKLVDEAVDGNMSYQIKEGVQAMPEKIEVKIETADALAAEYPDLCDQIGAAAVTDFKTRQGDARKVEVSAEKDRVLGLVKIQFGEEAGEKFAAVVNTGVTVDQFSAISDATATQTVADGTDGDLKAKMLGVIEGAGADNPGASAQQQIDTPTGDFMALVDAYGRENNCTKTESMQAVMKSHPAAHESYLKTVN